MNRSDYINRLKFSAVIILICSAFGSCNSILDMPSEDCSVEYLVNFKYDRNLKFADAFASEVKSVTVYAFDENGKFVFQNSEQGSQLAESGYAMRMPASTDNLHLVTWAGLGNGESFSVPTLTPGVSSLSDLTCTLNRDYDNGKAVVSNDLNALFHGATKGVSTRAGFTYTTNVSLTKNTNSIRIVLQQMSEYPIEIDKFDFSIEDANGTMSHQNELLDDEDITYKPWSKQTGTAEIDDDSKSNVSIAIAEFTTARITPDNAPRLKVTNPEGELIISIPIIDYALLVKGNYKNQMSDQEYLDCQDEYNMIFFLNEDSEWIASSIIINGWTIVLNDSNMN